MCIVFSQKTGGKSLNKLNLTKLNSPTKVRKCHSTVVNVGKRTFFPGRFNLERFFLGRFLALIIFYVRFKGVRYFLHFCVQAENHQKNHRAFLHYRSAFK